MNVNTGHLVAEARMGYDEIPKELSKAARKKLNGKNEAYVSLTSGGKLSNWANRTRNQRKRDRKRNK